MVGAGRSDRSYPDDDRGVIASMRYIADDVVAGSLGRLSDGEINLAARQPRRGAGKLGGGVIVKVTSTNHEPEKYGKLWWGTAIDGDDELNGFMSLGSSFAFDGKKGRACG
jgi:hypothetical protein